MGLSGRHEFQLEILENFLGGFEPLSRAGTNNLCQVHFVVARKAGNIKDRYLEIGLEYPGQAAHGHVLEMSNAVSHGSEWPRLSRRNRCPRFQSRCARAVGIEKQQVCISHFAPSQQAELLLEQSLQRL